MFDAHAYLVSGSDADIPLMLRMLEKEGVQIRTNPDLYIRSFNSLAIEDARQLIDRAALRPIGKRRIFLLSADIIQPEAQNALLKTLEEPRADALFILLYRAPETLLATMRSRMQRLEIARDFEAPSAIHAKEFVAASLGARLELLKPLLDKDDDDGRDMGAILTFLSELERSMTSAHPEALRAVYRARKYCLDRGALLKPLLEQVALLV